MNSIVFLYAGFVLPHAFDILFSESAFARVLHWASKIQDANHIVIAATKKTEEKVQREILKQNMEDKCSVIVQDKWNTISLLTQISKSASQDNASYVVYTSADRPFLDADLTTQIINCHKQYLAEYTFADGYPEGLAPEVIDSGTLNILTSLASKKQKYSQDEITNSTIFNVIKEDINSFEIETVIASKDYRMLRLDLSCSTKANTMACKSLFEEANKQGVSFTASALSDLASVCAAVQQTVPAFYNIQISENVSTTTVYNPYAKAFFDRKQKNPVQKENRSPNDMSLNDFSSIIDEVAELSETAVVGLSGFSEPLTVENLADYVKCVLQKPGLSVLIETDGTLLTVPVVQKISAILEDCPERKSSMPCITWIVSIDAVSKEIYDTIHTNACVNSQGLDSFTCANNAIVTLEKYFPGCVYPQFVRMEQNECELEKFYRFYHDPQSPSHGNLIIQKYDNFCGLLPNVKSADLAPLERIPCWHAKRDMFILPDGNVSVCREYIFDNVLGNVFKDGVKNVWVKMRSIVEQHIQSSYPDKCGNCDEYYTYNF